MAIKKGDVVRLKSGGPQMTVSQYPVETIDKKVIDGKVECEWFNDEGRLTHSLFNVETIEII